MPLSISQGLRFSGVNEYVSCGAMDLTGDITVELYYTSTLLNSGTHSLFMYGTSDGFTYSSGYLLSQNGTSLYVYAGQAPPVWTIPNYFTAVGEEVKITAVFDKTNGKITIYKNDVKFDERTGLSPQLDSVIANLYFFIGGKGFTAGNGSTSDFKVYRNGVLRAYYPLTEGQGTTAYDTSGNSNHGTITGATWAIKKAQFVKPATKPKKNMIPPFTDSRWSLHENTRMKQADFVGKVTGSTVENPNTIKYTASQALVPPSGTWYSELELGRYDGLSSLNGTVISVSNKTTNGNIMQELFSFNLIEHVLRNYGADVFGSAVTVADRVAWIKANIAKLTCNWHGYGSGPAGNRAVLSMWEVSASSWTPTSSHLLSTISKATLSSTNPVVRIDANGFAHFLAYADATDGVTASTVYTDFVELEVVMAKGSIPQPDYSVTLIATAGGQYCSIPINVTIGQTYTITVEATGDANLRWNVNRVVNNGAPGNAFGSLAGAGTTSITFTADVAVVYLNLYTATGGIGTFTFANPQLEPGSVETDFERYIPLPDNKPAPMKPMKNMIPPFTDSRWSLHENTRMKQANFVGKVLGSTVENPHETGVKGSSTLLSATAPGWDAVGQANIDKIVSLNGTSHTVSQSGNGSITQHRFTFNLIEHVLRNYGADVFGSAVTVADRVAWLKANIAKMNCNWCGYGSGPAGNRAALKRWVTSTNVWSTSEQVNATGAVWKLQYGVTTATVSDHVDSNGFSHFLAYADASDGVTASTINTDFVELEVVMAKGSIPQPDYAFTINPTQTFQMSVVDVPCVGGQTYTVSFDYNESCGMRIETYDSSGAVISKPKDNGAKVSTFTTEANATKIRVSLYNAVAAGLFTFTNPQLEPGSVATDFERYIRLPDIKRLPISADSFNRADNASTLGNADTGQAWTAASGAWGIRNGEAYCVSDTNSNLAWVDAGTIKFIASMDGSGQYITQWRYPTLLLHYIDAANYIFTRLDSGNAALVKRQGGVNTVLFTGPFSLTNGQTYNHKVVANEGRFDFYVDGGLRGSYTLTPAESNLFLQSTKVGIRLTVSGTPTFNADFDNFRIERL